MARRGDDAGRPHVVVVGGGFGGLETVGALARAPVDVTLVDRRNHHLFQPLLYEVATAALSPGQIAMPLRRIFRSQRNVSVVLGEVTGVELDRRALRLADGSTLGYDTLVLATGTTHHYFGNPRWAAHAPGLKSIDDAVEIRRRFLLTFERADRCADPVERARLMTTVIVGGGPTGIELAGTMSEVARRVLTGEFRNLDPSSLRIVLAEGADRVLPTLPPALSERARRDLGTLGVEVRLQTLVTEIDDDGVTLRDGSRIPASNVVWAAGVKGDPVDSGLERHVGDGGRIAVGPDLALDGHPEVFAIGDVARVEQDGEEVPGLAPAAMQMGAFVGRVIAREARAGDAPAPRPAFAYRDKGTMATIGRGKAVAKVGRLTLGGPLAWLLWVFVHVLFLVGFRNRLMVLLEWAFAYVTFHRGARLITGGESGAKASGAETREAPQR